MKKKEHCLTANVFQVTAPLFSSRLFDYGSTAGDQELPQALDVGKKLDLVNPISFFGSDYRTVYVRE